eukprot:CAMPEP_0204821724 /NCGR_PEP_ID=MMETSP1018-20131115/88031_1 /ASSEMBLY_ACC=CAM_ASM_000518 /TAXON_ID=46462 /ORGANISM="Anophryoides haemophila, Strain AH6" /LENGTH=32 /DNA_ID= /DNA_START= /DNA_END= /DNA_ORIENTATION=
MEILDSDDELEMTTGGPTQDKLNGKRSLEESY